MFDPKKFSVPEPKPLPVVLLLDVSDSMNLTISGMAGEKTKIEELNEAVKKMIDTFAKEKMEIQILVSIITFGDEVRLHIPYTKASQVQWEGLQANGMTPMGTALKMAKAMIEDRDVTPSRACRPTVVLVSDGQPNDSWEEPLESFISGGRSQKCDRMAMAIGSDADEEVLNRFIRGTKHKLFRAGDASQLHEFFQFLTMSVVMRSKSKNPNEIPD